jgi:hypothetical protein
MVTASVDDAVSGLKDVMFVDVSSDDRHSVQPFSEGQANEAVTVVCL